MKKILVILALLLPSTALADYSVAAGALLQCFPVAVSDSSSTTGAGLTGLVYNSASLACSYYRQNQGTSATSITLVTSTLGTHPGATSGGFIAIDGTKQPGEYEFCVPNAALASAGGVNWANFECHGATNMAPMRMRVSLLSPNTYGYDGTLASVSGTSVGLATAAIDATNQFAYTAELAVFDTAGLLEAVSCITASERHHGGRDDRRRHFGAHHRRAQLPRPCELGLPSTSQHDCRDHDRCCGHRRSGARLLEREWHA